MGEWKKVKLGEMADLCLGKMLDAKKNKGELRPYLNNVAVRWGGFDLNDLPEMRFGESEFERYSTRRNDIIACEGGEPGRCAIWESDEPIFLQKALHRIRVHDGCNPRFVYYQFCHLVKSGATQHLETGSTIRHLPGQAIREVELQLPDLPTQRRIAAVLGALDNKIEVNRKICENLEAQAQALFKGMKRRAEESSFVQVIDILSGGTPKTSVPEYWNGDIPFFSPKDVGGLFTISTERNITDQGLANCNSILYPKGTTFVTARGTVGKVCLAGVPMAMNQSCFALASNEIDPLLVYFYTCASVDSLKSKANGSVFAAITIAEFETEKIHRLTDSEEERFVKTIRPMFDQILVRQQESRALAAMRDALLPKLMSGELAVEKVEGV